MFDLPPVIDEEGDTVSIDVDLNGEEIITTWTLEAITFTIDKNV